MTFWSCRKFHKLISQFITSQPGKQTVEIQMLSNITRSKSNQTMKFGQLIRNIFHEKSYKKYGPFSKDSKMVIFRDQYSKVLYRLYLLY